MRVRATAAGVQPGLLWSLTLWGRRSGVGARVTVWGAGRTPLLGVRSRVVLGARSEMRWRDLRTQAWRREGVTRRVARKTRGTRAGSRVSGGRQHSVSTTCLSQRVHVIHVLAWSFLGAVMKDNRRRRHQRKAAQRRRAEEDEAEAEIRRQRERELVSRDV